MTRFNDNWFDVMFDEAVEALEAEAVGFLGAEAEAALIARYEEEEANRFF